MIRQLSKNITNTSLFNTMTVIMIGLYSIILAIQTFDNVYIQYQSIFNVIDIIFVIYILIELCIRFFACNTSGEFFKDRWNTFDFIIIMLAICTYLFTFINMEYVIIFRILRGLRILKFYLKRPTLNKLIITMLRSIPAFFDIFLLIFVLLSVYAVIGTHIFTDDENWIHYGRAMLSLSRVLTLDWTIIIDTMASAPLWAWLYFISYIFFASFILLNMFITVLIDKMTTGNTEKNRQDIEQNKRDIHKNTENIESNFDSIEHTLQKLQDSVKNIKAQLNAPKK